MSDEQKPVIPESGGVRSRIYEPGYVVTPWPAAAEGAVQAKEPA